MRNIKLPFFSLAPDPEGAEANWPDPQIPIRQDRTAWELGLEYEGEDHRDTGTALSVPPGEE